MRTNGARCACGLLDQPHERRVGALGCRPVCPHLERRAGVGRAAEHRHAAPIVTGSGSPLSVLVSTTASALDDGAVDGHDLAGAHDDDVADLHVLDRHLLDLVADAQLRDLRRTLNERRQLPARARRGDVLERRAAREHQPDDQPGELFAERERADHRDSAIVSTPRWRSTITVRRDLERQLGREQRDGRPPDVVARPRPAPARCSSPPTTSAVTATAPGCGRDARSPRPAAGDLPPAPDGRASGARGRLAPPACRAVRAEARSRSSLPAIASVAFEAYREAAEHERADRDGAGEQRGARHPPPGAVSSKKLRVAGISSASAYTPASTAHMSPTRVERRREPSASRASTR